MLRILDEKILRSDDESVLCQYIREILYRFVQDAQ